MGLALHCATGKSTGQKQVVMNGANRGKPEGLWGSPFKSLHPREGWKHQSEGLIASFGEGAAQEGLLMSTFL